jgi:adenosylhomocysteine nucleosidase
MNSVLVCFAVNEEAQAFRRLLGHRPQAKVLVTGMGRRNAGAAVGKVLEFEKPALVLTCGFAGGLNPELMHGAVVFATDAAQLREKLLGAGAKPAKFCCAARIATTATEKEELRRSTGADVVEMESEAIHAVCRERGIPCATVRVISDTAGEDLPLDFNRLSNVDLSLNYAKLALAIAMSPGKIPALLRLRKNTSFAAKRLAEALTKVIWPD